MFNYSDFAAKETESYVIMAPAYDFYDHVVQQNKRDDASRVEYQAPEKILQVISYSEKCERCGKDFEACVYIWNGKRLCKSCMEEGQETWVLFKGGPNATNQRVSMIPLEKVKQISRIESLISEFLAIFDLERIEKEIIIVDPKMPIKQARLLVVQRPDKKQMPESEGIMNHKKKTVSN
jgi:hypothetical protein